MPTGACTMLPPHDNDHPPHIERGGVGRHQGQNCTTHRLRSVNLFQATAEEKTPNMTHCANRPQTMREYK